MLRRLWSGSARRLLLPAVLGVTAVVTVGAAPSPAIGATAVPEVIGPIPSTAPVGDPSHDYVFYSTPMNLSKVGYVEQEYFRGRHEVLDGRAERRCADR